MEAGRAVVFALSATLVWTLASAYVFARLVPRAKLDGVTYRRVRLAFGLAASIPVWTLFTGRFLPATYGFVTWPGYLLMGWMSTLVVLLVVADVVRGSRGLWRRARSVDRIALPERRRFFDEVANLGLAGTASVLGTAGLVQARMGPAIDRVDVPIEGLPEALVGFSIAQISDLHVGPTIQRGYVEEVVARTNALAPDLIALTGDFVDGSVERLAEHVAPLRDLRAREGTYFVTGNHEYYSGARDWCDAFERLGITVLNNAHRLVERGDARLLVAGVTDLSAGHNVPGHAHDPVAALRGAPEAAVRLLLAHQPRSVFAAEGLGFDLQLSGHTHAGQYFPMSLFVHLVQPYVRGLHRHAKGFWIYVNRGTGYWGPPNRAGVGAEITLLRLVRAS